MADSDGGPAPTASSSPDGGIELPTQTQLDASKDKAIAALLQICANQDVAVSDRLRRAVLGEELYDEAIVAASAPGRIRTAFSQRQSVLGALARSHADEVKGSVFETEIAKEIREKSKGMKRFDAPFEVRIRDGSYTVESVKAPEGKGGRQHIETVANSGAFYKCGQAMQRLVSMGSAKKTTEKKVIMEGVNLRLEEGKMYLILGAPGCGKSTLLKMIANLLPEDSKRVVGGSVEVNGLDSKDNDVVWSNVVSYVDQIDRLHGYLTVKETLDFVFNCSWGGTHSGPFVPPKDTDHDVDAAVKELDEEGFLVDVILRAVGLKRVADTFVGNDKVRGV